MKKILITILLIAVFLVSGCAISEYLSGEQQTYSLLDEEEDFLSEIEELEEEGEIEGLLEELEEELEETEVEEVETETEVEVTEEVIEDDTFIKISIKENETVKLKPKAEDLDEDSIRFTFSEPVDENGEWKTNSGDGGNYRVTVTA